MQLRCFAGFVMLPHFPLGTTPFDDSRVYGKTSQDLEVAIGSSYYYRVKCYRRVMLQEVHSVFGFDTT